MRTPPQLWVLKWERAWISVHWLKVKSTHQYIILYRIGPGDGEEIVTICNNTWIRRPTQWNCAKESHNETDISNIFSLQAPIYHFHSYIIESNLPSHDYTSPENCISCKARHAPQTGWISKVPITECIHSKANNAKGYMTVHPLSSLWKE